MTERNKRASKIMYSKEETLDMIRCYFQSECNRKMAKDLYAKLYPHRHVPAATTIYGYALRSQQDPNFDMDQLRMQNPRAVLDVGERQSIVYTTRLDEMQIFKSNINNLSLNTLIQSINKESKPKLKKLVTREKHNSANHSTFNAMVQKLNVVKRSLHDKNKSDGTIIDVSTHEHSTAKKRSFSKCDGNTQEKNKSELFNSLRVALEDDYEINADQRKSSETGDSDGDTHEGDEEDDCFIVNPKHDYQPPVKKSAPARIQATIEIDDDDTDITENRTTAKTSLNTNNVHLYWRVYLSFICYYSNVNDVYYIDANGIVTDYYRIDIKKDYQISDLNKYVGPVKTVVFRCCCWCKRQEFISLLRTISKSSVVFMSKPHNCPPSSCKCCCNSKKQTKSKAGTSLDLNKNDEDGEIRLIEQEITNALLKITEKHERRKRWVVEGINKWLQELQKTQNYSTGGSMLINKGLMKAHGLAMKTANKTVDQTTNKSMDETAFTLTNSSKDLWNSGHVVVHILNERSKQIDVYEIFKGALISTAVIFCFNLKLRDLTYFLVDKLHESYDHLPHNLNVIRKLHVPCCWYFRDAVIKHQSGPSSNNAALNFMRQPHTCPVGSCDCCCRSIKERFIKAAALNKKLWQEIHKKILPDAKKHWSLMRQITKKGVDKVQVKKTPDARTPPSEKPSSSGQKVLRVEVLPGSRKLSAQIVSTDEITSVVDEEVISSDDDAIILPNLSSPPRVPNSVSSTGSNFSENPSSKMTLISSDMSCTITTYSLDEKEAAGAPDVDTDPLSGIPENQNDLDPLDSDDTSVISVIDDTPVVSAIDDDRDPLSFEETFKIEQTSVETNDENDDPHSSENTKQNDNVPEPPRLEHTPQPINKDPPKDLNVELLISTILERFRDVRLYINDEGNVTADLNAPVSTLKTAELKVLANILAHAQEQVKSLSLRPGTILNGQFGMAGQIHRNLNVNDPKSALYSSANMGPPSASPVTSDESFMPKIENVFSLKDSAQGLVESRVSNESITETLQKPKIRVRPPEELSVTKTTPTPAPILQNMLNGPNVLLPTIPDYPIFLPADNSNLNTMPPFVPIIGSNLPLFSINEQIVQDPLSMSSSHNFLPDIVTSSIQTAPNPVQVDTSTQTMSRSVNVNKKSTKQRKVTTPRTKTPNTKKKKELIQVSNTLEKGQSGGSWTSTRPFEPPPIKYPIIDVIEIDDDD